MRWFMDLFYPLMERARHSEAGEIAAKPPSASGFEGLCGARQALVVTFKRSGEAVPTPVNCALSDDGRLFFRSEPHTAKIKRIANNPRVLVGACSMRGKPRGPLAYGTARVLATEESARAYGLIRRNWSPTMWPSEMAMDRLGVDAVYVEVVARSPARTAGAAAGAKNLFHNDLSLRQQTIAQARCMKARCWSGSRSQRMRSLRNW
jgi:PPOX class probable F420-dependent enzyme